MFIDPIQLMQFGEGFDIKKVGNSSSMISAPQQGNGQTLFADIFENAIQDVIDTDNEVQDKQMIHIPEPLLQQRRSLRWICSFSCVIRPWILTMK